MAPTDAFDDAEELDASPAQASDRDLVELFKGLLRAEIAGARDGAVEDTIASARDRDRTRLLLCLGDALQDGQIAAWIDADAALRRRAIALVRSVAPPDPGAAHNARAMACVRGFASWQRHEHRLLIVPGYTPLDARSAAPGVHPIALRRLQMAVEDLRAGQAPFVLVSGGNVYPRGTPYCEALEMKAILRGMGVEEEHILLDARARHTTTNLRNAGRMMRALDIPEAVIVTKGGGIGGSDFFGQDFYLKNPTLSTFHARCERELGYRVGELTSAGDGRILFKPAPDVDRPAFRDPLDP